LPSYYNTGYTEVRRDILFYYEHALSSGTQPLPQIETTNMAGVPAGAEMTIEHGLLTEGVVPAFTPSWNTNVYTTWVTSERIRVAFSVEADSRGRSLDCVVSRGTREAVTPDATSHTITHNLASATTNIFISTSWNTVVYRTSKLANSMTVAFSTSAPEGSYLYWSRHHQDNDITGTATVADGSTSVTIEHNAGWALLPIFLLPDWNTTILYVDKFNPNQTVVKFSTPPYGAGSLDYRVKFL
jgi:hypothetical protein